MLKKQFPLLSTRLTSGQLNVMKELENSKKIKEKIDNEEVKKRKIPWYFRRFVKARSDQMKDFNDEIEPQKKNFFAQIFQVKSTEWIYLYKADRMYDKVKETVDECIPLIKSKHIESEDKNYFDYELPLWIIHFWFILRRLNFEGQKGKYLSEKIIEKFWREIEGKLRNDERLSYKINKQMNNLQYLFYGYLKELDKCYDALEDEKQADLLLADLVWKLFFDIDRKANFEDLEFWIQYIRYHACYFDLIERKNLIKLEFQFKKPNQFFNKGENIE